MGVPPAFACPVSKMAMMRAFEASTDAFLASTLLSWAARTGRGDSAAQVSEIERKAHHDAVRGASLAQTLVSRSSSPLQLMVWRTTCVYVGAEICV